MHVRQHLEGAAGEQRLGAVAEIALAQACHRRVDRHDERGAACRPRALEGGQRDIAAADEIDLVPHWTGGARPDFVDARAGERRQDVARAGVARGARRDDLATRVEHPRAAHRREQEGQRELGAEDRRAKVDRRDGARIARSQQHVVEGPHVLAQGHFGVSAAIDVVEDDARHPALGEAPEIGNVEHVGGVDAGHDSTKKSARLYPLIYAKPAAVPMIPRSPRARLVVVGLALAVAGLALAVLAARAETRRAARDAIRFPPPGVLADIGGRRLHYICSGEGSPTVIFENSSFGSAASFDAVRTVVSRRTRACAYDRVGMGWSDPGPTPISAGLLADDLHSLLDRAGIGPPYVLVPASVGGLTAELFARRYPDSVAGLVFVDAGHSGALELVTCHSGRDRAARLGAPRGLPDADLGAIRTD